MSVENTKSDTDGAMWLLLGVLVAVAYGLYCAVLWIIGTVITIWKALLLALQWVGWTLLAMLGFALLLDLTLLCVQPLIKMRRRAHAASMCPLPRAEVIVSGKKPRSPIEAWLSEAVLETTGRKYGGIAISQSDVASIKAAVLPSIVRTERGRFGELVVAPMFGKLQSGDPTVTAWIEHWGFRSERRPLFVTMRLFRMLTGGRLGWSEPESYRRPDLARLKSDPMAFEQVMLDTALAGILAIEELLHGRTPDEPGPEPDSDPRPPVAAALAPPTSAAAVHREPAIEMKPDPDIELQEETKLSIDPVAEAQRLAGDAVTECERLLSEDDQGWDDPAALLDRLAGTLNEVSRCGESESLALLRERLEVARGRLPDLESWLEIQLSPDYDPQCWSAALVDAALEAEIVRDLSAASVCRRASRRFLLEDPARLAPTRPIDRVVPSVAVPVEHKDPPAPAPAQSLTLHPPKLNSERLFAAEQLF